MWQSYDVSTKIMLLNHAKKRDNAIAARKFRVLKTKNDGGDSEDRSLFLPNAHKNISVDPSMVVFRNQNKK
jgi:hypothetical protein